MIAEFLKGLPISDEQKRQLASRGASTPLGLLTLRKANPSAFDEFLGADEAAAVVASVSSMLSDRDRETLNAPLPPRRPLGARLGRAPAVRELSSGDLGKREQLSQELQSLRAQEHTPGTDRRISELEAELSAFLNRR